MTVHTVPGRLSRPVLFFKNVKGHIQLPPTDEVALRLKDGMRHRGYELMEAATLKEIDRLQKELEEQDYRVNEHLLDKHENLMLAVRKQVRDRLNAKLSSSAYSAYEKDFIREYIRLRDDKRAKWRQKFTADTAYFMAREFDNADAEIAKIESSDNE